MRSKMNFDQILGIFCLTSILALGTCQEPCDLTGDWIALEFYDFNHQNYSSVTLSQTGAQVSVKCTSSWCPGWASAAGTLAGPALTLKTNTLKDIEGVVHRSCDIITTGIPEDASANWLRVHPTIRTVHMVFMTHLDVGYTLDTSMDVLELYRSQWFPKAYATIAQASD